MCYIRNSSFKLNYQLSVSLFEKLLVKQAIVRDLWKRNILPFEEGRARFSLPKLRNDLGGIFVFPLVYSKDDNEVYSTEKVLRTAGAGLPLLISFFFLRNVNTKLKNLFRMRRLLHEKTDRHCNWLIAIWWNKSTLWFCLWRLINIPYKRIDQFYIHDTP